MLATISVLIVNYNGEKYIKDTILSCKNAFNRQGFNNYEILVLDNASYDNSNVQIESAQVESDCTNVKLFFSKENLGFAKGCNYLARKATGQILYLLNNDTFSIDLKELTYLIGRNEFKSNSLWAIKTLNKDKTRQNNVFTYPSRIKFVIEMLLLKNMLFRFKKNKPNATAESLENKYFSGCALLISKDTFLSVGGFDEDFYFYHEECDLFLNVQKKWKGDIDKRLLSDELIHFGGGGGVISEYSFIAYYTNLYRLYLKHSLLSKVSINFLFKLSFFIKIVFYILKVNYSYSPFTKTYKHLEQERSIREVYDLQKKLHKNIDSEFKK
ncbi:TPA: glycosyltransferase family 2 protein [Enterobacter ludwigii]